MTRAATWRRARLHLRPRTLRTITPPTRVLFFVETGAANRFWQTSIPLVAEAGYAAQLVTLHERGPLHESLEAQGIETLALNCRRSWGYPRAALRLGRLLREQGVDILHCSEPIQVSVGGAARVLRPETMCIFHRQHTRPPGRAQGVLSEVGSRISHYTVACSEATADWAHDVDGVPREKLRVARYGVPAHRDVKPDEVSRIRDEIGVPEDGRVILLPGYFRVQKGHRILLEALPSIEAGVKFPVHVLFVGSGPEETEVRRLAGGRQNVHFAGYQYDIAPWFAAADVVTMPSLWEAFGLTAAEAFAARRPLIATDVEGLREIVTDESCGILVPPGEPEALAAAIVEVLNSPARAEAMGQAAYARFQSHLTVKAMVDGWLACYAAIEDGAGDQPTFAP